MRWALVAVASGVVLLGAVIASRMLVDDVEVPAPSTRPVDARPVTPVPQPIADVRVAPTPPPAAPAPSPQPVAPVAVVPAPSVPAPVAPPPVVEPQPDDEGPWAAHSRELNYADGMLKEEPMVRERVLSAHDVFERCLTEEPDNERCLSGLKRANALLKPVLPNKSMKDALRPMPSLTNDLARSKDLLKKN